jgi:pantothenate kinase
MELPQEVNVTEQMVDISNLSKKQTLYYKELAEELKAEYVANGESRQIFTLSGPAGSGKSVVSAILGHIFSNKEEFIYLNVGLDGFHYPNAKLAELELLDAKGRYDTYDTELLFSKMLAFTSGEDVTFPYYSRESHNPIVDELSVTGNNVLLLLEGQWLLRDKPEWSKICELSSFNLSVSGSIEDMRENVIRRHMVGGRTTNDAMNFYAGNDLVNTHEIEKNSVEPDIKVLFYKDI